VPKDPSAPDQIFVRYGRDLPFVGEPVDSREAIMRATYLALREYGYAGLSIQRIADESDLSKSTFYHHYDGKGDLLTAFVDFTLEEFIRIFSLESGDDQSRTSGPSSNCSSAWTPTSATTRRKRSSRS